VWANDTAAAIYCPYMWTTGPHTAACTLGTIPINHYNHTLDPVARSVAIKLLLISCPAESKKAVDLYKCSTELLQCPVSRTIKTNWMCNIKATRLTTSHGLSTKSNVMWPLWPMMQLVEITDWSCTDIHLLELYQINSLTLWQKLVKTYKTNPYWWTY